MKLRKKTRFLICLAALVLAAPFSGFCGTPDETPAREPSIWKIGTLAPDNVGWAKHAKKFIIDETIRTTNGEIRPVVYWGGVMGDDEDYLSKMRIGQLDGAGLSGQGAGLACPEFSVVELPFLFNDYAEVDFVRSRLFDRFDGLFAKYGLKLLYWVDQDFDQIYSSKNSLARVKDFQEARFVLWYGPVEEALLEALDAQWVTVGVPESAAAWRMGTVDASIAPATWMVAAQLGPVLKWVNPVKIRYSPVVVVITDDAWRGLPQKYKKIHEQERERVTKSFTTLVRKDNQRSLDALVAYGVKKVKMGKKDLEELRARGREVYGQLGGLLYPKDLLKELESLLEEYRK